MPSTNGYYQFVNVRNGWCAYVKGASPADGAKVTQWPSTGGSNQDWQILAVRAAGTLSEGGVVRPSSVASRCRVAGTNGYPPTR
ncbi:RICIN domain-containing protein [Streptomyces sp. 11x1]|uniref:RICIN domain-containing protein n=1 Tax=Streptomyces sp. 11x1 TaxID=3038642 RepID=UPI00292D483F|nr:RICIN domain-containing protein [Streptomyces sp. 11x1]WNZ14005.1 RICIN domain-containing protein [Streptomyces sp. 11x1]